MITIPDQQPRPRTARRGGLHADAASAGLACSFSAGLAVSLLLVSTCLLLACGKDNPTQSQTQVAVRVDVATETTDLSALGQTVNMQAIVYDADRQAIAGSAIRWTSTDPAVATVDADGLVTARSNGTVRITALSGGVAGQVQLTVYVPPPVGAIRIVSGAGQRGLPDERLLQPVVVKVLGTDDQPIPMSRVVFSPGEGHGLVDPDTVLTGSNGTARTDWTLGPNVGVQTLTATVSGRSIEIDAEATDVGAVFDSLFAPPDESELATIRNDWAGRDVSAFGARVEFEEPYSLHGTPMTMKVVSHLVGNVRHYGAIVVPRVPEGWRWPMLVFNHGGDDGIRVEEALHILALFLGDLRGEFVYVLPSYRDETLRYGDRAWRSDGPASPWDYDVDDAIALVNVARETTPEVAPGFYMVTGASRGGGVSMLMGRPGTPGWRHHLDLRSDGLHEFLGPRSCAATGQRGTGRQTGRGLSA